MANNRKITYLVTGAAGFIGANLIYALELLEDVNIIGVVHSRTNIWRLLKITSKVKVVKCDLTNYQEVENLIKMYKPEYIIHLAVKGICQHDWFNPADVLITNYSMDVNLFEVLKSNHNFLTRIVTIGSMYEFGNQSGPMKEDRAVDFELGSLYALSKRVSVIFAGYYSKILPMITLRFSTVYGPYNDLSKFIEGSINAALNKKSIKVATGVKKDFIYIDDVTEAVLKVLSCEGGVNGEVINIGSGLDIELIKIAHMIVDRLGKIVQHDLIISGEEYRREDDVSVWMDIRKALKLLGWRPSTKIEDGIFKTIDWYKNNKHILPITTG